jgi:hypothetical protein
LTPLYLSYLSKPAADRPIYQAVRRSKPRKIVELGMGTVSRSLRLIGLCSQYHAASEISFTGMDLFEGRPADQGVGITLKEAHRALKATGARIQLAPGGPYDCLARLANALGKVDLLIFSSDLDPQQLEQAWAYVPRLLGEHSLVFAQSTQPGGQLSTRLVDHEEIGLLARGNHKRAA